jgi:uridylate kinase
MYKNLHYNDVVQNNIKVMDQSALLLARDYELPVHVFNFNQVGAMKAICSGERIGTLINNGATELLI